MASTDNIDIMQLVSHQGSNIGINVHVCLFVINRYCGKSENGIKSLGSNVVDLQMTVMMWLTCSRSSNDG